MRVVVDPTLCTGHARCEAVAGAVYRTDPDDGYLHPLQGAIPPELEPIALRGARACPERAITVLAGADDGPVLWPPAAARTKL